MKQKEFTRDDYKDLDFVGKKRLKEYRDGLAKELNQKRNTINSMLEGELDGLKGIEGLQGEYERAKKHAKNTAKIRRAWNILDTRDNARRKRFDESMKSIDRQFDVKDSIRKHEELAEKLRAKKALGKDLKKAGKVAAGTALAAGLIYGAKKLYDKNKNKDMKEQKEFARTVYETEPKNVPMETPKVAKEKASKLRDIFNRTKESIKNSKVGKNAAEFYAKHEKGVKIGGGVAAGTALAAGLAVGAKKLADKKKEQQKEFARADYAELDNRAKRELREYRNKLAKELNFKRNEINKKLADDLRAKKALGKSLKKIGYTGLGLAGTAALAYGGKKLYDKYKKDQDSEKD
jgi:hypothetical protein|nr:MAG TPA: hypothetical protein [Bacteriophage sp.]